MKAKKGLIIFILLALILSIWYYNWQAIKKIPGSNMVTEMPHNNVLIVESLPEIDFVYKDIKYDPFNLFIDTTLREPTKPILCLKGIVIAKGEALALMELSGNETYLMKKGETYLGVKIKEITPKYVTIEFRGKKEVLKIWE